VIHGDDQVAAPEVVGMDLSAYVTDVVAAQTTLVRREGVGKVTNVIATCRRRIEGDVFDSASASHVVRNRMCGWGPAMVPQADEEDAEGLGHVRTIQLAGVKRRNRKLLLTTKTLDEAIAALATIGDSNQHIANGIAATL
jgi:hypothetical protein